MTGLLRASAVAGLVLILAQGAAQAADDKAVADPTCETSCGTSCAKSGQCCTCPCQCVEMRVCKEIVYDYEEITLYKTVYEEVVDKHVVNAVKYVEETQYRCIPTTAWQPEQPCACAKPDCCDKTCCQPKETPTCFLRRVPYTAYRPVSYQKTVETPRVVAKQVPYKVTKCIPREVCREVPVKVPCPCSCCEKPCCGKSCCGKPCGEKSCGKEACGETTVCAP